MVEFVSAFPCNNAAKNLLAYSASEYDIGLVLQSFCQVVQMWILYIVHLYFLLFYMLIFSTRFSPDVCIQKWVSLYPLCEVVVCPR